MDKLQMYYNGGEPFVLDDLKFAFEGLTEGITALASFFNNIGDPIIVSGIVGSIVGPNTVFTAGFIVVNGEPFYVPAGSIPTASANKGIDIAEVIDVNGDKVYENGTNISAYRVRKGLITDTTSGTWIDFADFRSAKDLLLSYGLAASRETGWNGAVLAGSWVHGSGTYAGSIARYRIDQCGEVNLEGSVSIAAAGGSPSNILTLAVGFRPPFVKRFTVSAKRNATDNLQLMVLIYPNGSVNVSGHAAGETLEVSLDNIKFSKT